MRKARELAPASLVAGLLLIGVSAGLSYWFYPTTGLPLDYRSDLSDLSPSINVASVPALASEPLPPPITHLPTPKPVRALYLTGWVAGSSKLRQPLIDLAERTEINALVIDIKDYTGHLSFVPNDPGLLASGVAERRIADIEALIHDLHERGIYVIGRVAVFQDNFFVDKHPELAVRRKSDGEIWRDRKGIPWLEVGAEPVWDYTVAIAREAHARGFDEINFDYIRFPSDGPMNDISYQFYDPTVETRADVLEKFFIFLDQQLADLPLPLSADLFGLATVNKDDLGIGQVLERAAAHFDYLAPMVYPSHYASGFLGYKKPATAPYEVVKYSMDQASLRVAFPTSTPEKLRPWLQDFDLGAIYTAEMVRVQKQAVYDSGLDSWMLWDPANKYTPEALDVAATTE